MNISSWLLIAMNIVPLIGVLFFEWDVRVVIVLYWIENLIIGIFNMLKMSFVAISKQQWKDLGLVAFFAFHYGAFCAGHGNLLLDILGMDGSFDSLNVNEEWPGPLVFVQMGWLTLQTVLLVMGAKLWLGIAALFLSRFVSFIENFIFRAEYANSSVKELMTAPYKHLVVLHVGLIAGAMLIMQFDSPVLLLAVLVALKTFFDFKMYKKRHQQEQAEQIKDV